VREDEGVVSWMQLSTFLHEEGKVQDPEPGVLANLREIERPDDSGTHGRKDR
jgi:hypothetical protein